MPRAPKRKKVVREVMDTRTQHLGNIVNLPPGGRGHPTRFVVMPKIQFNRLQEPKPKPHGTSQGRVGTLPKGEYVWFAERRALKEKAGPQKPNKAKELVGTRSTRFVIKQKRRPNRS